MEQYFQANRKDWDQKMLHHEKAPFYDLDGFKRGKDRLRSIELEELEAVSGKTMIHLQCYFDVAIMAWVRLS